MQGALRSAIAALLLASLATPSRADDAEPARRHFVQGSKDFDLGLYDKAIEEYMAAYNSKPDPALLYNIAQAHKLAGHPGEAVRFYKTYLSRVPDAANADEVRAKIAELQKAIDQQHKAQAMPPDQIKSLDSVPTTTPPPKTAAPTETLRSGPSPDAHVGRTQKIAGIAVAGVGVAVLSVGIGLAIKAKQDSDQLSSLDQQHGVFDPGKDSSGRTLGVVGPVLIGVGAAAVIVGGVVLLRGQRASHRATTMASAR